MARAGEVRDTLGERQVAWERESGGHRVTFPSIAGLGLSYRGVCTRERTARLEGALR